MMEIEKRILVVDDEEDLREILQIYLTEMGYEVLTAADGQKGVDIFLDQRPPIVLSDIKMPVMDGVEMLRQIKAEDPEAEVIMITGHGDMALAIESLKLEAADFITKPINDDVLEIALRRVSEKIAMRRQLKAYTENLESLVEEKSAQLVEMERLTALGQAVECLTTAFLDIAGDVRAGMEYFNEVPCFVALHNRQLQVVAANRLFRDRLGDMVGRPSWEIYAGPFEAPEACPAGQTFQTGAAVRSRETIRYRDGQTYPVVVHTAPIHNSRGELELVLEISADISEIARLQEALRTTQQRYHQLFEEVPCYIAVVDREFNITAANRRFRDEFGENAGPTCYEVYKKRQHPCRDCPVTATFEDGQSHQTEMTVTAQSGDQRNLLIWTAPITNAAGETTQVMEMATDITPLRQLQDRLASLGLMVSSVSHGVKGVLTGMDGGVFLMNTGLRKDNREQIQEGFDIMKLMTERIRSVVLDVLYYAKERALSLETVVLPGFVIDVAAIVEPRAVKKGITLTCRFDQAAGPMVVDPVALRTALINLLENAVDACGEDQSGRDAEIVFEVAPFAEDEVEFKISDNGIGMDAQTRENLFDLFYSSKADKGTGLGLHIAKATVEQHNGSIRVDAEPGQGACFTIRLPRRPRGDGNDREMDLNRTAT
ncbi:MAG: response regulator [Desulfobacterales bacterium]|nr:response regulator [Desulfobacterales bacterium]MDJ0874780.1 response regulator [Desulfobacterales bacterium]